MELKEEIEKKEKELIELRAKLNSNEGLLKELKEYITELKCEHFFKEFEFEKDVEVMEDLNNKAYIGNHLMLINKNDGKCSKVFIVRGNKDFLVKVVNKWVEKNKKKLEEKGK